MTDDRKSIVDYILAAQIERGDDIIIAKPKTTIADLLALHDLDLGALAHKVGVTGDGFTTAHSLLLLGSYTRCDDDYLTMATDAVYAMDGGWMECARRLGALGAKVRAALSAPTALGDDGDGPRDAVLLPPGQKWTPGRESITDIECGLLEVEAARAMSGRPAWRVVAACVKGGSCPRCGALTGVKCRTPHIERVWAQRARERGAAKPARVHATGAQAFIDVLVRERVPAGAVLWRRPDTEGWHWPDECGTGAVDPAAMDAAIALGLVRLAISGGIMPVWVVTDLAQLKAKALAAEVVAEAARREAAATVQPSAPTIDAAAAAADFAARIGEG